uniref:Uncharacterized protein n=1 Tax=Moniliophthora roreri TaxID=221103 RepID=A0A0W0EX42_MONRR
MVKRAKFTPFKRDIGHVQMPPTLPLSHVFPSSRSPRLPGPVTYIGSNSTAPTDLRVEAHQQQCMCPSSRQLVHSVSEFSNSSEGVGLSASQPLLRSCRSANPTHVSPPWLKLQSKQSLSQSDDIVRNSGAPDVHLDHHRDHVPISDCTGLMNRLVVSSSAYIHVTCVVQKSDSYDPLLHSLLRISSPHLRMRPVRRPFQIPNISYSGPGKPGELIGDHHLSSIRRRPILTFILMVNQTLPLVTTQFITLGLNTSGHIFLHLASLPHLQRVTISGDCAYYFMDVFTMASSPLPFPALDILDFTAASFQARKETIVTVSLRVGKRSKERPKLEGVAGELYWGEEEMADAHHQPTDSGP